MDAVPENSLASSEFCIGDRNLGEVRRCGTRCSPAEKSGAERPLRVLVVDDDRGTADSSSMLMRLWGHDALCAYDGATALELATRAQVDVVLLDIALPGMDGCQVAAQLRGSMGSYDCLLIAVTGLGADRHRHRCHQAGFDLFLVKPVDGELLELLLLLERKRLRLMPARPIQPGSVFDEGWRVAEAVVA